VDIPHESKHKTCREAGEKTGRFPTGSQNATSDIKEVCIGHVTQIEDDVTVPESDEKSKLGTEFGRCRHRHDSFRICREDLYLVTRPAE
jgi:hypothetical protein